MRVVSTGVEWSRLDGPFEVGTKGKSKSPGFPAARFRLLAVEAEKIFASEMRLPGARLVLEHVLDPVDAGVRITHRAKMSGPLSFLWVPLVRKNIERGLPDSVERLAATSARSS